jgi:Universal stress protein family
LPSRSVGAMRVVLVVVAVWAVVASTLSLVMARRGHDPFVWWLLGAVLGPLAVPLAVAHRFRSATPLVVPERDESGKVLVAVRPGADAGDVSQALAALAAVGGPLEVTLATALDADTPGSQRGREAIDGAARGLGEVAETLVARGLAVPPVPTCVLFGDPAVVLAEHAADCGFSLLAVGAASPRSHRIAHGSTRVRLSRRGQVPVLLAPTERDDGAPTSRVSS